MKIIKILLVFFFTMTLSFGGGSVTDWIKLRQGAQQRIEFKGASGKTTLIAAAPTGTNVITFQDGTGTAAFLSDLSSAVFNGGSVFNVDGANVGDPLEDGTAQHPFDLIAEALAASAVDDFISVAPGSYPEALVIPHNIFLQGLGVKDLVSIDISSGRMLGRIWKWEFHAQGVIIYPDGDQLDNGLCLEFGFAVGVTQSVNRYGIGLIAPGSYDIVDRRLDFSVTNGSLIDVFGIGVEKPKIITTNFAVLLRPTLNNFDNLEHEGDSLTRAMIQNDLVDYSGNATNLTTNGRIALSVGSSKFTGFAKNLLSAEVIFVIGTGSGENTGDISDIFGGTLALDNYSGTASLTGSGSKITVGTIESGGVINFSDMTTIESIVNPGTIDIKGLIQGGKTTGLGDNDNLRTTWKGNFTGFTHVPVSLPNEINWAGDLLTDEFVISNSKMRMLGGRGIDRHTLVDGARFNNVQFLYSLISGLGTGGARARSCENKGIFNYCIIRRNLDDAGDDVAFPVSDGFIFTKGIFQDWDISGDPLKAAIVGRDLIVQYGLAASGFWDFSEQKLVWELDQQPEEANPAGGYQLMASGTTFDATIYKVKTSTGDGDGDLTLVKGLLVEMEVFEDTLDVHGLGVGTFVVRTTATDATLIDNTLSNPAADIDPDVGSDDIIGMEATITLTDTELNGAIVGQEITVITTALPTAHDLGGSEHNADTLANLNSKVSDATLIDTTDSRLSDDRDPTAHASEHTNGTDDIQNATAAQKGLATATQITKLDGIETSATADQSDAEIETAYNNQVAVVTQGDAEAGTSTTVTRWTAERVGQAIAALAASSAASSNKLAGSDFSLDSSFLEATSDTSVADDTYAGVLWNILSDGASVVSWAQETTIVDTNRIGSLKMTAALADKKFGMVYFIEQQNLLDVIGGVCSIRFRARKDATTLETLRAAVISWDSTADVVVSDVVSSWSVSGVDPVLVSNWTYENTPSDLTLTTGFQTFQIESISVDTASTTNVALFIWVDDTDSTAADDFYIDQISLQAGATATAFPNVTEPFALIEVQRYYEKSDTVSFVPNHGVTDGENNAVILTIPFKVTKISAPTMAITTSLISSPVTQNVGIESFTVNGTATSTSPAQLDTWTATARF